jgi:hypothetical protein
MAGNKLLQAPQVQTIEPYIQNVLNGKKNNKLLQSPLVQEDKTLTQNISVGDNYNSTLLQPSPSQTSGPNTQDIIEDSGEDTLLQAPQVQLGGMLSQGIVMTDAGGSKFTQVPGALSTTYIEAVGIQACSIDLGICETTRLEIDPVFMASPAFTISLSDIVRWNTNNWQTAYDYDIEGERDGSNRIFLVPYEYFPGSPRVHLNGLRLQKGIDWDYIETGVKEITLNYNITQTDLLLIDYIIKNN